MNEVMTTTARMNVTSACQLALYKVLIKAQLHGQSSMPYQLGLSASTYKELIATINDHALTALNKRWVNNASTLQLERSNTVTELVNMRDAERTDIINLLKKHRNTTLNFSEVASTIIATACLNSAHLWKSLGFDNRRDLTTWMKINFPDFAAGNNNMRWKRYIYLQLCQQGGDYVCRAPSCDECSSFKECFLPE